MMPTAVLFGVGAFLLGLIVGSFLNVCIYRMPREESLVYPPSHCPKCYQPIRAEDNIPVVSWLILRGRCRSCGLRISPIYPAVELFTGLLFLFYYWRFALTIVNPAGVAASNLYVFTTGALYLVHMAFICALLVAAFVDFKYLIIPDEISLGGAVFAVAASVIFPEIHQSNMIAAHPHLSSFASSLFGAAVGAGIIYSIGAAGKLLLRKEAMGLGDVKLMAMIGAFLGWQMTLFVVFFSAILGTVYGGAHLAVTGKSRIPYGPFLAIAAVVSLVFRTEVAAFLETVVQNYSFLMR